MKKKIIFFDGDGTLWYPKKTKFTQPPWWIYKEHKEFHQHKKHLMIIPHVISTLKKLRAKGIITIILSTHPHPPKESAIEINNKVTHFKIEKLFDEVHATRPYLKSKGQFIIKILKRRNIPKSKALMIGDSYEWDYSPAKKAGIDALLIESPYMNTHPAANRIKKTIKKFIDMLKY